MVNSFVSYELSNYQITSQIDFSNATREIMQKCILCALSKTDFFSNAAFYGGTCLRIFHQLDRFSEDLDFVAMNDSFINMTLDSYIRSMESYLKSSGFSPNIVQKQKSVETSVYSIFVSITINDFKKSVGIFNFPDFTEGQKLSIKLDIETKPLPGAKYESKMLLLPYFSLINCLDYSSLFSSKIFALTNRKWSKRVKGRDYYDFYYYVANHATPNYDILKAVIDKNIDKTLIINMLKERFVDIDFALVKKDVRPFLKDDSDLSFLSKDVFLALLDLL